MAMAANETTTVGRKLEEIFNEALNLLDEIEKTSLPFNSPEYQGKVKKCVGLFEDSTRLVSLIGMFSTNEMYNEIATEYLHYLLLPYFLGQLSTKMLNVNREDALKNSETYYKDFLKRCEEYEIIKSDNSQITAAAAEVADNSARTDDDKMKDLIRLAGQRNSKIEQYRRMKELEEQIAQLKLITSQQALQNVDDEIKRDLYLKTLNHSVLKTKDELVSLEQELQILEFRKLQQKSEAEQNNGDNNEMSNPMRRNFNNNNNRHQHHHKHSPHQPLKPVIITRDAAQKAVFGMGYPSLPVMSVADFYEERVASGIFPNAEKVVEMNAQLLARQNNPDGHDGDMEEAENIRLEQLEENDDDENLARLRAKDAYKDEVRRGDGNRHNRS